jgi:uncharacterized sulfatase
MRKTSRLMLSVLCVLVCVGTASAEQKLPNILWLTSEDNGQQLGCYGDAYADTPNLDRLAEKSLRYKTCWSNAPVCAPARTTIISGMYATSLGGQHMRSGVTLPTGMKLYPQVIREAGYYCSNRYKTDYNFTTQDAGWHDSGKKAHFRNRPDASMPFFSIFNFTISHESKIRNKPHTLVHDPTKARVPAYQPDTSEVRRDWAQYYDRMTEMDREVGQVLDQLQEDGLADSTIVFYYGDHGSGMPRSKRWPFDSGLRVPLLVHVPEQFQSLAPEGYAAGGVSDQLVAFVDLAPTLISLVGTEPLANMQGTAFAGPYAGEAKKYLFGYRGRMDERIDMVRSVTDGRYVYMKHFYPDRPYLKHIAYMFQTPTTAIWKRMFDEGKLNEVQAKVWKDKPFEELFDLQNDPDEVNNLVGDSMHQEKLDELRTRLKSWMIETKDMGLFPEAEMHRVADGRAPRDVALSGEVDFAALADAAWDATDDQADSQLFVKLSQHPQGVMRFWAARGLTLRHATESLAPMMDDECPSVAIAACEGLVISDDEALKVSAQDRLVELANADRHGHFAAIAALNVIDMRIPISDSLRQQLSKLPGSSPEPIRVKGYSDRLLEHALSAGKR